MSGRTSRSDSGAVQGKAEPGSHSANDLTLATMIVEVARDLARTMPPPRGAPYFCLDTDVPYDLRVFDALSARGIFRKYEFALEIGCGLGGRARWLAARSSCRVVGVDARSSAIAAAIMLNRRARMDDQVFFQVGRPDDLPLRERVFTHAWILDADHRFAASRGLAEAFRVLRRGGHFAMQCPVPSSAGRQQLVEELSRVGFVELDVCETPVAETPHACRIAQDRLRAALQYRPDLVSSGRQADAILAARACVQIFARRPA
jgi:SAM-dependent methyltransferase